LPDWLDGKWKDDGPVNGDRAGEEEENVRTSVVQKKNFIQSGRKTVKGNAGELTGANLNCEVLKQALERR